MEGLTTLHSVTSGRKTSDRGKSVTGQFWKEIVVFSLKYTGNWAFCDRSASPQEIALVKVFNNQLVAEVIHGRVEPYGLQLLRKDMTMVRYRNNCFDGRSTYLDSFDVLNDKVLRRPGTQEDFSGDGSGFSGPMRTLPAGFDAVVRAGWRFRLPEREGDEVDVEIKTNVNSGWFPFKRGWNLDEFAPSCTADESYVAMTGSASGVALGLLKGVGSAEKTTSAKVLPPPKQVTFAKTENVAAATKPVEAKVPPPFRSRLEQKKALMPSAPPLMPAAPPHVVQTYGMRGGRGGAYSQSQARLADRSGDPRGDTWWASFAKKLGLTEKKLRYLESDLLDFSRRKKTARNFAGADQEKLNRITAEDLAGFESRYVEYKERDTVDTSGKLLPTQMLLPVGKKE